MPISTKFHVVSDYQWDTSRLYSTGEVTLTAVPEPSTLILATLLAAAGIVTRRRMLAPPK